MEFAGEVEIEWPANPGNRPDGSMGTRILDARTHEVVGHVRCMKLLTAEVDRPLVAQLEMYVNEKGRMLDAGEKLKPADEGLAIEEGLPAHSPLVDTFDFVVTAMRIKAG